MAFFGVVAQGVLPDQAAGQVHIDMRTGAEGRQRSVIDTGQLIAADVVGFVVARYHQHFDHAIDSCEACSLAIRRSRTRRDCTPPASILSLSKLRAGWLSRFCCWRSSISRSSLKILPCPSRM